MAQAKAKPAVKKVAVEIDEDIQVQPLNEIKITQEVKPSWETKDRVYILKNGLSPLTYTLKGRNIFWFDEDKGYERELKYSLNQKSVFVDEFQGQVRLGHIVFEDGVLNVPKEKQTLQKLLSLYHPDKNRAYVEYDPTVEAEDELSMIELEMEAMQTAATIEIDHAEAILRAELGSKVSNMSSKELKRDLYIFAKKNPILFLELANDDNIQIRNLGIKAVEQGIIKLSGDQRTFVEGNTGRKLLTVPFDENPYSALAAWFKTDDGIEVYQIVEKKLK